MLPAIDENGLSSTLCPQDSQPDVGTRAAASTSNKLTFMEHLLRAQHEAGPVSFNPHDRTTQEGGSLFDFSHFTNGDTEARPV